MAKTRLIFGKEIYKKISKTSELENDGEDTFHPFITLEDIPEIDISSKTDRGEYEGTSTQLDERIFTLESQTDVSNLFIEMTQFSLENNILTVYSGWIWKLLGSVYSNTQDVLITIPYCAEGKTRIDYIVPNELNGFTRIQGEETLGVAQAPQLPAHRLYVTFFVISDNSVGEPQLPNVNKTPSLDEVLSIGYSTKNIIWFYSNNSTKCLGVSNERLLFQKGENTFNELRADNTTESYNIQFPNKTGGTEETLAMISDLELKVDKEEGSRLVTEEELLAINSQINAINVLLQSDNVNLDNVQELVDAIESVQLSLSSILVNDLTTGGVTKALTAEMGKTLKGFIDTLITSVVNKVDKETGKSLLSNSEITRLSNLANYNDTAIVALISAKEDSVNKTSYVAGHLASTIKFPSVKGIVDWAIINLKSLYEGVITDAGISRIIGSTDLDKRIIFSNANPVTITLPDNTTNPLPIGFSFKITQQGAGIITVGGTGITFISASGLTTSLGETRKYIKTGTDTWTIEGSRSFNNATFTGTTVLPSTTSIGSITATILGYLSGITSNVQNQLNAKLTIVTGTTNFLPKVTGLNIFGNSRLWDTGTFFGVGVVNTPTKDITLGRDGNKTIGIEQSDSVTIGRDLVVEAGRTINFVDNTNFISLNQQDRQWTGILSLISGDVLALDSLGNIYKQTNGLGNFNLSVNSINSAYDLCQTPNGDIYVCSISGIYKQTGGVGSFNSIGITTRNYFGIASSLSGDIYTCVFGGDIYKQTGGVGNFNALGQASRQWHGIGVAPNGDIYCSVYGGDIYKQTSGVGSFNSLGQTSRSYRGLKVAPNGNVYVSGDNMDIYMQTGGMGSFNALGQTLRNYHGIGITLQNDVYAVVNNGGIYKQTNNALGTDNLDGGIIKTKAGTGKGTGKSRWQAWTGQKTVSGTDMQVETLRMEINEDGLATLPSTTPAIISADATGKALVTKEYLGTLGNSTADMSLGLGQTVIALKTFLAGTLGLRNVANTITSFFSNTNTVSRTYTLQNRDGTLADLTDIAGVNSGKMNTPTGGIASYLPKFLTGTTMGLSRLWDTGTFFGIGTISSPTKDITLGNQKDKEIGIEESNNTTKGRDLKIAAGRTINYVPNINFNSLNQVNRSWSGAAATPNGNVYAITGGDIYKQTNGSGDFISLNQNLGDFRGITATADGSIYVCVENGDIYKQTNGAGNFVPLGQISREWRGMASAPNGNIYCVVYNGDIYMQTNGTGNFIPLGQTNRGWYGIASAANGQVYATVLGGDIYTQTAGVGNFISQGQPLRNWTVIAVSSTNNVYATVDGGDIYMQTNGSGSFTALNQGNKNWRGLAVSPNTNVYCVVYNGDIFMQNNNTLGTSNLDGGTLKLATGTGKGAGKSRWQVWTGQKLASGTDMQIETLRLEINEEGLAILPSTTKEVINADTTNKALVTKEYAEVTQITISTVVNITTDTLDTLGFKQKGRNVILDNGGTAINLVVNGGVGFSASYMKFGTGSITFLAGSGRTLVQVDATAVLNGIVGSTATITSVGTVDYLRISNAS